MTNKEHISGGVRLKPTVRMDGRVQYFPRRLDFRQDAQAFTDVISNEIGLLEEGLIIGFVSRFYTAGDTPIPVAFKGVYTGKFRSIQVPYDKLNPGRKPIEVSAPIFDVNITSLDTTTVMAQKHLGEAAIPCVLPATPPFLQGIEMGQIGKALGIEVALPALAQLDGVRYDSLYYVPNNIQLTEA